MYILVYEALWYSMVIILKKTYAKKMLVSLVHFVLMFWAVFSVLKKYN
jgi:hypothetical protein